MAQLSDEDYGAFQSRLAANPGLGALIKGGGGIRKIRVAAGSRGKRGGPASFITGRSETTRFCRSMPTRRTCRQI